MKWSQRIPQGFSPGWGNTQDRPESSSNPADAGCNSDLAQYCHTPILHHSAWPDSRTTTKRSLLTQGRGLLERGLLFTVQTEKQENQTQQKASCKRQGDGMEGLVLQVQLNPGSQNFSSGCGVAPRFLGCSLRAMHVSSRCPADFICGRDGLRFYVFKRGCYLIHRMVDCSVKFICVVHKCLSEMFL